MNKTIYDIMSNDPEIVSDFKNALGEMVKTRYILAEKKINSVLKIVASSKILYNFFGNALRGFDYEKEVMQCRTPDNKIILPTDKKHLVAFVFCLLNDIDTKSIALNDFLRQFYQGDRDIGMAYNIFCYDVINPFIAAFDELYSYGFQFEEPIVKSKDFTENIAILVNDINNDPTLLSQQKEEYIFSLDNLGKLLRTGEYKSALAVYEALYPMLAYIRLSEEGSTALADIQSLVFSVQYRPLN